MTPPTADLTTAAFLASFRSDVARILAVAPDRLTSPTPGCPGWDVADVVRHTGEMYLRRRATITSALSLQEAEPLPRGPQPGEDLMAWYAHEAELLLHELETRDEDEPTWTRWPAEQRIGFWARRMAQETLVHRADIDLAGGDPLALDENLALDGIDEILRIFLCGAAWEGQTPSALTQRTVRIDAGGVVTRVRLAHRWVNVSTTDGPADAGISGSPADLLLWLWGRPADVNMDGDESAVAALRAALDAAGQ